MVLGVVGVGITGVLDIPTPMGEFVAVVVSGPVGSGLGMTTLRGCSFIIAAAAARLIADKFGGCCENVRKSDSVGTLTVHLEVASVLVGLISNEEKAAAVEAGMEAAILLSAVSQP